MDNTPPPNNGQPPSEPKPESILKKDLTPQLTQSKLVSEYGPSSNNSQAYVALLVSVIGLPIPFVSIAGLMLSNKAKRNAGDADSSMKTIAKIAKVLSIIGIVITVWTVLVIIVTIAHHKS